MGPKTQGKPHLITLVLHMRHQDHSRIKSIVQHRLALPKSTLRHKPSDVGVEASRSPKLRTSSTVGQPVS